MSRYRHDLPLQANRPFVTDAGLETELIFKKNYALPEFASFPLLESEQGKSRIVPVAEVETPEGPRPDIPAFLTDADKEYLITRPSDRVQVHFDTGTGEAGTDRSFFLASDGYYIEWMRKDWLTNGRQQKFRPGTDSLLRAINNYAEKRDEYREEFESTKIEVR